MAGIFHYANTKSNNEVEKKSHKFRSKIGGKTDAYKGEMSHSYVVAEAAFLWGISVTYNKRRGHSTHDGAEYITHSPSPGTNTLPHPINRSP